VILSFLSQFLHTFGAAGLLWIYLVLHLCVSLMLPYRQGVKPYFFMMMESIGLDIERRLNRETRPQSVRFIRGIVVAVVLGGAGFLAGYIVRSAGALPHGWVVELVFLSLCINFMAPLKLVRYITRALRDNQLQKAVKALQPYLNETPDHPDSHTVIRKTIEFIAFSLNRFLTAPAFWFLAAGPVGMALYITYAALTQAFGLPDPRRIYFGRGVRIIDAVLNLVPSLVTTLVLAASALFVSKSNPLRALATVFQYPSAGPIAAMAGGLGVTLGGSVRYSPDYVEERPWIGPKDSSARVSEQDLARAAMMQYIFYICMIGLHSVFMILEI
jgi:adenosylcobinamide-phosphate synthase